MQCQESVCFIPGNLSFCYATFGRFSYKSKFNNPKFVCNGPIIVQIVKKVLEISIFIFIGCFFLTAETLTYKETPFHTLFEALLKGEYFAFTSDNLFWTGLSKTVLLFGGILTTKFFLWNKHFLLDKINPIFWRFIIPTLMHLILRIKLKLICKCNACCLFIELVFYLDLGFPIFNLIKIQIISNFNYLYSDNIQINMKPNYFYTLIFLITLITIQYMLDKILKQLIFRILCCDFQNITCYSESKCRISCKCKIIF